MSNRLLSDLHVPKDKMSLCYGWLHWPTYQGQARLHLGKGTDIDLKHILATSITMKGGCCKEGILFLCHMHLFCQHI